MFYSHNLISDKIHFHTLMSSFGSFLLQNGIPISVISELLGHSSILVTQKHYTSLSTNNLVSALFPFNEVYLEL